MRCNRTQRCPRPSITPMAYGKTKKSIPNVIKRTPRYLMLLPPADDDTNIALNLHQTYTHPPLEEGGPFGRVGIHFDRILHQKKDHESFQLPPSKVPSPKQKTVSNAQVTRVRSIFSSHLPSHIATPPPNGMVWFATDFPFFVNFFCTIYLVGIYSLACS